MNALFDAEQHAPPVDLTDPRTVPCPACGAPTGRPCRRGANHPVRLYQARHQAGVADEPAPQLFASADT